MCLRWSHPARPIPTRAGTVRLVPHDRRLGGRRRGPRRARRPAGGAPDLFRVFPGCVGGG
ncbi:hypothetical protein EAO70_16625 [Streptomyces sp. adm13(2018)]|nr:hypothetical protein EAO70_16625 [Streptomyces sp. adm13(2018)]